MASPDFSVLKPHIVEWLARYSWTHFATLGTNDHGQRVTLQAMHDLLKRWDARMNRRLFGHKWSKRVDERLFAAFFLEKAVTNPHWHGLIMLDNPDTAKRAEQALILKDDGEATWQELKPGGTFDFRRVIAPEGIARYVTKELGNMVNYKSFVVPRGFDARF